MEISLEKLQSSQPIDSKLLTSQLITLLRRCWRMYSPIMLLKDFTLERTLDVGILYLAHSMLNETFFSSKKQFSFARGENTLEKNNRTSREGSRLRWYPCFIIIIIINRLREAQDNQSRIDLSWKRLDQWAVPEEEEAGENCLLFSAMKATGGKAEVVLWFENRRDLT